MIRKNFLEGIRITKELIHDIVFMCENRTKPTYFTRTSNCKMDFTSIIHFQLNFIKKTLQLELNAFFKNIKGVKKTITKQGYSEARQKISPAAFIKMADAIISWYYDDVFDVVNSGRFGPCKLNRLTFTITVSLP